MIDLKLHIVILNGYGIVTSLVGRHLQQKLNKRDDNLHSFPNQPLSN